MTDKITSAFVPYQIPANIRDNDPLFVDFIQAYYQYLEQQSANNNLAQQGYPLDVAHNLQSFIDIDTTLPLFANTLYNEYMSIFPTGAIANKATLLKNIKQFYTTRGSQNSYRFLMRALFGEEISIVYPGQQILIASSGKWILQQLLQVNSVKVNGVPNSTVTGLEFFVNTQVVGQISGATASVESVFIVFENNQQLSQLFVSSVVGTFTPGEEIQATDINGNVLTGFLNTGSIVSIEVTAGGFGYAVNEIVPIQSPSGNNAVAIISAVTSGNVTGIQVVSGGAGFLVDDPVGVFGSGGFGANGFVSIVSANNQFHPNTYIINSDIIAPYLNVALNSNSYGFPAQPNANLFTALENAFSFFSYGPTGPAQLITLFAGGADYSSPPTANISGNTIVRALGILGRMNVVNSGTGYANGEVLIFTNVPGGAGYAGNGNVVVNATGSIITAQFTSIGDQWPIGGLGYDDAHLPSVTINTAAGVGGNIVCVCTLATGDQEAVNTSTIGTILGITVLQGGNGYFAFDTTVNLQSFGSGTATAVANISQSVQTQAGRFLDDTGFLSSAFYLEDANYYMNYAYVIKIAESITKYQSIVKQLLHPAGTIMWGEYLFNDTIENINLEVSNTSNVVQFGYYNVQTVLIAGNTSYLFATNVANASPSVTGTFSTWFDLQVPPPSSSFTTLFLSQNSATPLSPVSELAVIVNNNGSINSSPYYVEIIGSVISGNTSNIVFTMTSNVRDVIQPNAWNHIVASWDLGNGNSWLYLNNTQSQNTTVLIKSANSKIDLNAKSLYVGINPSYSTQVCLAEVYFNNTYINLSNVTNRQLFISNDYLPVYLGPTGNTPSGSNALVYLNQPWYIFGKNQGIANNFSNSGPLLQANTSPVPYI